MVWDDGMQINATLQDQIKLLKKKKSDLRGAREQKRRRAFRGQSSTGTCEASGKFRNERWATSSGHKRGGQSIRQGGRESERRRTQKEGRPKRWRRRCGLKLSPDGDPPDRLAHQGKHTLPSSPPELPNATVQHSNRLKTGLRPVRLVCHTGNRNHSRPFCLRSPACEAKLAGRRNQGLCEAWNGPTSSLVRGLPRRKGLLATALRPSDQRWLCPCGAATALYSFCTKEAGERRGKGSLRRIFLHLLSMRDR
ncbi:hypothetical protein GQ53DRAFT_297005 [Thozetella sp. PMI_491]|nr:hypothetical protein GQ53DRAFT_297005 [Thozetella sp. PMI_491]